jgi:hypothetical protein
METAEESGTAEESARLTGSSPRGAAYLEPRVGGPFLTVVAKLRMASSRDSWGRGPKIDLLPLAGVSTGDGRPARLELGAGGALSFAAGRLLLVAAPRLLGGRAFEALALRGVALGLLAGARAAAVNAGRLAARAGFRLLGGRCVAAV